MLSTRIPAVLDAPPKLAGTCLVLLGGLPAWLVSRPTALHAAVEAVHTAVRGTCVLYGGEVFRVPYTATPPRAAWLGRWAGEGAGGGRAPWMEPHIWNMCLPGFPQSTAPSAPDGTRPHIWNRCTRRSPRGVAMRPARYSGSLPTLPSRSRWRGPKGCAIPHIWNTVCRGAGRGARGLPRGDGSIYGSRFPRGARASRAGGPRGILGRHSRRRPPLGVARRGAAPPPAPLPALPRPQGDRRIYMGLSMGYRLLGPRRAVARGRAARPADAQGGGV